MRPTLVRTSIRLAPLVALATAAALIGPMSPADARAKRPADRTAPVISSVKIAPSPLVLAVKKGGRTSFQIAVRAADAGGVDRVTVGLYDPVEKEGRAFRLSRNSGSAADGQWKGTLTLPNTSRTGMWEVRAFATDLASNTTNPDLVYTKFRVLNKTRINKFTISVDPKTSALSAEARLERFRRGQAWEPFSARVLTLEFQAAGAADFTAVATATTDNRGQVSFGKVTASKSGSWRIVYGGHPNYGSSATKAKSISVG